MPPPALALSDAGGLIERGLRHERAGMLDEALRCYEGAAAGAGDAEALSSALRHQADVLRLRCEWDEALERSRRSEAIAREAGQRTALAEAINAQAAVHQSRGTLELARPLYEQVLEIAPHQRMRGVALQNLGAIAAMQGDYDEAVRQFEDSVACFQADGYERGAAIALNNLGRASLERRDFVRAEEVLRRALTQARQIDDLELSSVALVNLAEALLERDAFEDAEAGASESLGFFKVSGNLWRQVECLRLLGDVHAKRGHPDVALRLYRQALATAEQIDAEPEAEQLRQRMSSLGAGPFEAEPS